MRRFDHAPDANQGIRRCSAVVIDHERAPLWLAGRWVVVMIVSFLAVVGIPPMTVEAEARIQPSHLVTFPTEIVFRADIESDRPVRRAALYYRVGAEKSTVYATADVRPGAFTVAEHRVDLQRDYMPPGSDIRYYWVVEDDLGVRSRSDPIRMTVMDDRHAWRRVAAGDVVVFHYAGNDDDGRTLLTIAGRALNQQSVEAGIRLDRPVQVFVYGSVEDFQAALDAATHEWAGGRAFPEQLVVMIAAPPTAQGVEYARRAIPHELSHVIVHFATDNPFGDIPQWLSEGLAMRAEGPMLPPYRQALDRAVRDGTLMSVRSLGSNFPVDAEAATLAYAQSHSLVDFVVEEHGRSAVARILSAFRAGATSDDALQSTLGLTSADLDGRWRASLGGHPLMKATPFADLPAPEPARTLVDDLRGLFNALVDRARIALGTGDV